MIKIDPPPRPPKQEESISGEWKTAITLIGQLSNVKEPASKRAIAEQIELLCRKKKEDYCSEEESDSDRDRDAQTILGVRQNAMEMLFTAHEKILKNLLSSGKLTLIDFNRKMAGLRKWVDQQKTEVSKMRELLHSNFARAQEMLQRTKRDLKLAQEAGSSRELLDSLMESIGCQEEPLEISHRHVAIDQDSDESSSVILLLMQREMRKRQVKEAIDRRIYSQLTQPKNFTGQGKMIITSLYLVNIYLSNLSNFLYSYYKDMFLNQLNNPFGYPPEQRLRIIHGYAENLPDFPDDEGLRNTVPLQIFGEMNQQLYGEDEEANEYELAHNRALFDAFNLAIRYFRPYFSIGGSPYHWTIGDRALTFFFIEQHNLQEVFQKSKHRVMQWASSLCALHYPDSAPSAPKSFHPASMDQLLTHTSTENPLLHKVREDRLAKMEKDELNEEDHHWHFYEEERTGFMLELSEQIFVQLCEEVIEGLVIKNFTFL